MLDAIIDIMVCTAIFNNMTSLKLLKGPRVHVQAEERESDKRAPTVEDTRPSFSVPCGKITLSLTLRNTITGVRAMVPACADLY